MSNSEYEENLERINSASTCGSLQQQVLAFVGIDLVAMVLRKNTDYGGSAWEEPILLPNLSPGDAILVRMGDKIQRIRQLLSSENIEVNEETVNDTMRDLAGYALLWLARNA